MRSRHREKEHMGGPLNPKSQTLNPKPQTLTPKTRFWGSGCTPKPIFLGEISGGPQKGAPQSDQAPRHSGSRAGL